MLTINGQEYSRKSFDDYKLRVIVEVKTINGETHRKDIYTSETELDKAYSAIVSTLNKEIVVDYKFVHHATKESDDASSILIDEWIKELDSQPKNITKEVRYFSECSHCEGKGEIITGTFEWVVCPHCDGEGRTEIKYEN